MMDNQIIHETDETRSLHLSEEEEEDDGDGESKRSIHGLEYIEEGFSLKMDCVKCGFQISEMESCFACRGCPYTAHKACAKLPETISGHPFLASGAGKLVLSVCTAVSPCYYCREAVHARRGDDPYYAGPGGLTMHATCALVPLPAIISGAGEHRIFCHRSAMALVEDEEDETAVCFSCGASLWGIAAYRCSGVSRCKIFFHKSCAELPGTTRHPSHGGGHNLKLAVGPPETCGACGKMGCRHVYYCERRRGKGGTFGDECEAFALGAECAFRSTSLSRGLVTSHKHELFLAEGHPGTFQCDGCRKSHSTGSDAVPAEVQRSWDVSFRCRKCVFNLHFLCGPLPSAVQFEFHIHPLRLVDLLIDDDSGEYCCDVCEEDRDPRFRVYHCSDCKFVAHVHCLISEIMKLLKEESSTNVEFIMLGESSVNGRGEIESVKGLSSMMTLDGLTAEDLKSIRFSIHKSDSSINKTFKNQGRRLMSFLDDNREHKIVDVDIIKDFFHLNSQNFSELCWQIAHLRPGVVLQLDDKYLRMKVVDVRGYMVPWALASDLKMLLHKYGHLGGDSALTPQRKSIAATLLCAIVNRMRNTMAQDMTIDDVKFLFINLYRTKKIAGFKVRECDCFEECVITTFLGFEAIRFEKEAKESVGLKIAELEVELETWKKKREKLEEFASTKSDFMKKCLQKASGSKWKTIYKLF